MSLSTSADRRWASTHVSAGRVSTDRVTPDRAAVSGTSRTLSFLRLAAVGADVVCIVTTLAIAGLARDVLPFFAPSSLDYAPRLVQAGPFVALTWVALIALLGGYERTIFGAGTEEYKRVLNASFATSALIGIGCYLARFQLSRGFFLLSLVTGTGLLVAERYAVRRAVKVARARGFLQQRVLIVGTEAHVDEVAGVLARESWLGLDVVGALTAHPTGATTRRGVPVIGAASSTVACALAIRADVVFMAGGAVDSGSELRQIAWALESTSTQVVLAPSITDVARERIKVRPVGGLPLIHLEKPRSASVAAHAKRVFDVTCSVALIVVLGPVFLLAAYQVWRCDHGPVLFRQERIGRNGSPFHCLKFRTMVTDAEDRLVTARSPFVKSKHDPRVTRPGHWMRRYSVDELPQLFNVIRGEMSLVGPRPQVAHEVALYDDAMARRLRVRPGMTGLWQVSGRSDLPLTEAIRLDLYYVDNWSMVQDLAILVRTFGAVLSARGAY